MIATLIATVIFVASALAALLTVPGNMLQMLQSRLELTVRQAESEARTGSLPDTLVVPSGVQLLQVVGPDGRVLAANARLAGKPRLTGLPTPRPGHIYVTARKIPDRPDIVDPAIEYLIMAVRTDTLGGPVTVYGAASVLDVVRATQWLYLLLFAGTPLVIVVVAGITWGVVTHALAPVERIRSELAEITGRDLSRRVPVPATGDEITDLAATTNDTLNRLERSAETQRRFVADASHELRSPITALRTQLEYAATFPDDADWPSTGEKALMSADRLAGIIEELLMLARLDAGAVADRCAVDCAQLAEGQVRRRAGCPVTIHTDLAEAAHVHGSPVQLDRLLTNLLDNAVRHAAGHVDLCVKVDKEAGQVVITVTDDGAGIAPEDRERVFERFTRLPEGRARDAGGSGLGLSLAREIAMAHHGTLSLTSHHPGAQFVCRLPLLPHGPHRGARA
jgi:signal transduction histidine kinase